jgi:hypothetical protein
MGVFNFAFSHDRGSGVLDFFSAGSRQQLIAATPVGVHKNICKIWDGKNYSPSDLQTVGFSRGPLASGAKRPN